MKIISGKYKGRTLNGFDIEGTRPTMDRVKESVFAMIQDYIPNSVVLDLYAGTGNLAVEALSNGALSAYLVDNSKTAINTINKNINMLNIDNANVIRSDASLALKDFIKNKVKFDIIFLDPPYQTEEINTALKKINNNDLLNDNAIVVCETQREIDYSKYNNLAVIKTRNYGPKTVTVLQKNK